jgi:hypothetical protein
MALLLPHQRPDKMSACSARAATIYLGQLRSTLTDPAGVASLPTQSTVQNTSQLEAGDQTIIDGPDHHQEELPLNTPLQNAPARTNPVRCGRPPEGSTEHLTILLDTVGHGKLPEDYQPSGLPLCEIIRQPGDIPDSWVAQSHFFPEAGLG